MVEILPIPRITLQKCYEASYRPELKKLFQTMFQCWTNSYYLPIFIKPLNTLNPHFKCVAHWNSRWKVKVMVRKYGLHTESNVRVISSICIDPQQAKPMRQICLGTYNWTTMVTNQFHLSKHAIYLINVTKLWRNKWNF